MHKWVVAKMGVPLNHPCFLGGFHFGNHPAIVVAAFLDSPCGWSLCHIYPPSQEPIDWRYLPYIFGLFFRPKFQGISQQNMALDGVAPF